MLTILLHGFLRWPDHFFTLLVNLKRIAFSSKILRKLPASHRGGKSLQNYGQTWIEEVTIICRISRYSNISCYEHYTLVHMQGDTSLQTVVGTSILKKNFGLTLIKFTIWPLLDNIERSQTLHSYYPLTPPHTPPPSLFIPTILKGGGGRGGSIYSTV